MNRRDARAEREAAYQFGRFAEEQACHYYISQGYAILERNWRSGRRIEIDIIARKDNIIVFIEVKARKGNYTEAIDAVTFDKMKRMARGADIYLRGLQGDVEYRYDIFALTGNENVFTTEVIEDAFLSPLKSSR